MDSLIVSRYAGGRKKNNHEFPIMEMTLFKKKKKKKLVGESNLIKKQKGKQKRCKLPGPETLKRQRRLETSAFEQALKARKICRGREK